MDVINIVFTVLYLSGKGSFFSYRNCYKKIIIIFETTTEVRTKIIL